MLKNFLFIVLFLFSNMGFSNEDSFKKIVDSYTKIAHATYEDSFFTAKSLRNAIDHFLSKPTTENLALAKSAWLASRIPYQQSEVFRFGNTIVDNWEGKVNAWPLDEGLIDYVQKTGVVSESENPLYASNVIANNSIFINGNRVDATDINPTFLAEVLHEAEGIEANVATGYHAIEFLLWGQDLNGNNSGNGIRPASDYDIENCTHANCARRAQYLKAAVDLLVQDLEEMVSYWTDSGKATLTLKNNYSLAMSSILMGMGSLSYGELAGERMQLGLYLNDPEEEHDCFSDNTHNSHYYNQVGISNIYYANYKRINGNEINGYSLSEFIQNTNPKFAKVMNSKIQNATIALSNVRVRAENIESYDQMIARNNIEGNNTIQVAINALVDESKGFEELVKIIGLKDIKFEGSDSLDSPEDVFK
jgi:putative iron-regulated protein